MSNEEKKAAFIDKANDVHKFKYDYSEVKYVDGKTKVKILCPEYRHGIFEQRPDDHIRKHGCGKCGRSTKLTLEDFIYNANKKHKFKYDYSKVEYKTSAYKVDIICPKHGVFTQTAGSHLYGIGCLKCGGKKQKSAQDFIIEAKKVYGEKYIYDKVEYKTSKDVVTITCPIHGDFTSIPRNHILGQDCNECRRVAKLELDRIEFINDSNTIHKNIYDYSKVNYINKRTTIDIICLEHGVFPQLPKKHLDGFGCPKCDGRRHISNTNTFIEDARKIHGDDYDYSKVRYTFDKIKVNIICPEHGIFPQSPKSHLRGSGCPKCIGRHKSTDDFIIEAVGVHGDRYTYGNCEYGGSKIELLVTCKRHGDFEITPNRHLRGGNCPKCRYSHLADQATVDIQLINQISEETLTLFNCAELLAVIAQGSLDASFSELAKFEPNSTGRIDSIKKLKEELEEKVAFYSNTQNIEDEQEDDEEIVEEVTPTANLDIEESSELDVLYKIEEDYTTVDTIHGLDKILASKNTTINPDDKAIAYLIESQLHKLWNEALNDTNFINTIKSDSGQDFFNIVRDRFLTEYDAVSSLQIPAGYSNKHQPNMMQKLTIYRLMTHKNYGNWSKTGSGKTISSIISSRAINSKLTLYIVANSTKEQIKEEILNTYPDSLVYVNLVNLPTLDYTKNNYLIVNYEDLQQGVSQSKYNSFIKKNNVDFVVLDEVHNVKQRGDSDASKRRETLMKLLAAARAKNSEMHTLAMSATPVINDLAEAKSLLQMLTGNTYDDIDTRRTLPNALRLHRELTILGLRYKPKYDIQLKEIKPQIDGTPLIKDLSGLVGKKSSYIEVDKRLINYKLIEIKPHLAKGVVIYSHFVDGFIDQIQSYVNNCGFTTKAYTGDEESNYRNIIIDEFTKGQFDILICSRPISTGVDGLQKVCNKLIILSLPWTSAEFEQLIGRFYRQGSNYKTVDVVIPQVFIPTNEGEWSFDKKRYDIITYKQTLANCVVDGVVVNKTISPEKILEKAIDALKKWKERLDKGEVISIEPTKLSAEFIEGTPEYKERQRNQLTEYNSRWGTMNSDTLHNELKASPEKWHEYHNLRGIAMQSWSEDPNVFVAKQIEKMSGDFHTTNIADMGCGINTLAGLVKNSTFKSFDHVAVNENVIACDIKDVSKHVEDEKMNVVVFCLALNAHNYPEFLTEGNRIMREKGNMLIVLPSNKPEKIQEVKEILAQYNLEPKEEITFSGGKFTYLRFSR